MKETHEMMDSIEDGYGQNTKDVCSFVMKMVKYVFGVVNI